MTPYEPGREIAAATNDADVVAINHWLSLTRLRAASAVAVFAAVMAGLGIGPLRWLPVVAVCSAMSLFSAVALLRRWGRNKPWTFFYVQTAVDVGCITVGIAAAVSGKPAILFSMLYLLTVVPSSLASVRAGLLTAALCSVAHLLLIGLFHPSLEAFPTLDAIAPVFLYFLAAQQCFFYAGHLERKNRDLAQLASSLESSHQRLENLIRIARTLNSTHDARELLAHMNQAAIEQLRAAVAKTFLVDAERQTFRLAAVSDSAVADNPFTRIDFPIAPFPAVVRLASEAVVELGAHELVRIPVAMSDGLRLSSAHLAGLHRDGQLIGFLAIGYTDPDSPSHDVIAEQLAAIAEHSTIALGNAKLLEEARQASDLKSEFLSTVSHELRTPLNVIIGYTEMLRDGAAGALNAAQDELFRRIEASGRALFDLIEAVLQVGRLETGAAMPVLAPTSVVALLKTIEGSIAGLPRSGAIEFEWIAPRVDGVIVTDAAKVGLIVRNLVGNAFKFTPRGKVSLRVEPAGDRLEIEVRDTGIGIAAESIPHIFEMFRQLKGSEGHGGVGLGLHIVKQIVQRLGGSVEVESLPGQGSTFRIILPRYTSDSLGEAEPSRAASQSAVQEDAPLVFS